MEMLDEIVSEFLVESYESLDQLDRDLMALEETPDDRDRMSSIFRTIHTIKGTSGFLALSKLEKLTHVGESLLVPLRDGELTLTNDIANALLAMVDAVRSMLATIEQGQGEGEESYEDLIETLEELKTACPHVPESAEIAVEDVVRELSSPPAPVNESAPENSSAPTSSKAFGVAKKLTRKVSDTPTEDVADSTDSIVESTDSTELEESTPAQSEEAIPTAALASIKSAKPAAAKVAQPAGAASEAKAQSGTSLSDSNVRIDVHLLDKLMNLVGELVLARNQIMQFSQDIDDAGLIAASQRVNLITTELQEGVMKTRMQPIRNAWSKLPRVVRDLSQVCGKNVHVKMEGADTELDKTILEAIKDPLTHIVRNSVDHGIESPEVRAAAGKPQEGTLLLRAYHEGGQVIIEIIDDGGGIGCERVRAKAIEKGLVTEEQAAAMSDREAVQLILLPGFSTAAKVTNVSGRGVGMDVVKTNVEKIGGTLEIQSTFGKGTTLRIKIPLTLAIVPALVVACDNDRYCIPQVSLLELVRLEGDRVRKQIEELHSVPVYRLRGQLLPLVYLDEELGLHPRRTEKERREAESVNVVVLQAEDRQFGLVVDAINDTQEIVVKPLGHHVKNLTVYAGSTIMGDGAVALILDVIGIAQQSHVLTEHASRQFMDAKKNEDHSTDRESYLLVDPGDGARAAIPLSSVSRLEEVKADDIERSGHQQVVQYRGEIMPLVSLSDYGQINAESGSISLVVFNAGGRNIGVCVGRIVDIVNETIRPQDGQNQTTRIIDGRVTQVVDLAQLAAAV